MLEIQRIRKDSDLMAAALQRKGIADAADRLDQIIELDRRRREIIVEVEDLRREAKAISKSIGNLMGQGKSQEAEEAKNRTTETKERIKALETELGEAETRGQELIIALPNTPHPSVPSGQKPEDNEVISSSGPELSFDFEALPHWELAVKHKIIDWKLGVKLTGAGFPVYKGKGAAMQRALITFFLDRAIAAGFEEIQPPLMVNEESGYATGQLPDKDSQMYVVERDGLYLIPTAEVPITNLYRDLILEERDLPVKNCGYTPCFRREAGSYGAHVKGLNRLHQFDKVEIVQIARPEDSYQLLEEMTRHAESLLEALGLPWRKLLLCSGDMSFTSAKTYDLEVFSAAQERWLEVSSVSNFETYQTNRLKLRIRDKEKNTRLAHSLNGSALALPRILAALLENNQQADGSILVPEVLRPYTRFDRIG